MTDIPTRAAAIMPTAAQLHQLEKDLDEATSELAAVVHANCDFRQEFNTAVRRRDVFHKMLITLNEHYRPGPGARDYAADLQYALESRQKCQRALERHRIINGNLDDLFDEQTRCRTDCVYGLMGFNFHRARLLERRGGKRALLGDLVGEKQVQREREELVPDSQDTSPELLSPDEPSTSEAPEPLTEPVLQPYTRPQRDILAKGLERINTETETWIAMLRYKGHRTSREHVRRMKLLLQNDKDLLEAAETNSKDRPLDAAKIEESMMRLADIYDLMEKDQHKLWKTAAKFVMRAEDEVGLDPKTLARPKDWRPDGSLDD